MVYFPDQITKFLLRPQTELLFQQQQQKDPQRYFDYNTPCTYWVYTKNQF